ncbi:hypothetical protein JOM56_013261 [Amanita muscaria]
MSALSTAMESPSSISIALLAPSAIDRSTGESRQVLSRSIRASIGHAPIGEYRTRSHPDEDPSWPPSQASRMTPSKAFSNFAPTYLPTLDLYYAIEHARDSLRSILCFVFDNPTAFTFGDGTSLELTPLYRVLTLPWIIQTVIQQWTPRYLSCYLLVILSYTLDI